MQQADDHRLGFLHMLGKKEGREHGRDRKGGDQGPCQRVTVGARHGAEDLALDPLHGEQRHETGHGDERREKDRLVHLHRADQDHPQAVGPCVAGCGMGPCRWVRSQKAVRQTPEQALPLIGVPLEIPEDILHENDRGIHNDAEIDGADGEQVGAFPLQHQQDDGEEKRKGDIDPNDDRAAEITQENPLDQEDQQAPENEIVQDGMRRDCDQRGRGRNREPA